MIRRYKLNAIELGQSTQSAHVVYPKAIHQKNARASHIVVKLNKKQNANYSHLETAFSGLTELFIQPNLTPSQRLVVDVNDRVVGVASHHLFYQAQAREGLNRAFYSLVQENNTIKFPAKRLAKAQDIPIHFLNNFSSNFFTQLSDLESQKHISFDIPSLASILTTSYTLEEDDLHKGNIAFYVVEKEGKPHLVFLKIDHDLMLSNSIMSFQGSRWQNWLNGSHAFDISARDLRRFPYLLDSDNYYWPTTERYFTFPFDKRVYGPDIEAFRALGKRADFIEEKWRNFYKHILMPAAAIEDAIAKAYDKNNDASRAQLMRIKDAVIARQAHLRAVLFSLPEFQYFIQHLDERDHQQLVQDTLHSYQGDDKETLSHKLNQTIHWHKNAFIEELKPGDTPLHVAIRLNDFRYDETWLSFSQFANKKNDAGECPLDVVMEKIGSTDVPLADEQCSVAKYLLEKKVKNTSSFCLASELTQQKIKQSLIGEEYLAKSATLSSTNALILLMRDVSEDSRFCLKTKKNIAMDCLQEFIGANKTAPNLRRMLDVLKQAVNGQDCRVQYIRQLRSELWIIRQIRGEFGRTSTLDNMNALIDKSLAGRYPMAEQRTFFPRVDAASTPSPSPQPFNYIPLEKPI